jgi:anthraniloyl-CoA monooxygenase
VRIHVLGGGPAGLYLSILMKRIDPSHEITVFERNAPDATFGWGVVFSEGTLGGLREADHESYAAITDAFATWDTIEAHYDGRLIRSRGHAFSAISRKVLLGILQRRALQLGVDLRFEVEVAEPAGLAEDCDVLVGADGVNSAVRRARAGAFGPAIRPYPSRFVWFGTDLVFDAFTFVFRPTEYGMFQVHAYPFDAKTSTFIVECNEETFQRAGLDGASEAETIAFCEELFAGQLRGRRLFSNRSIWQQFLDVGNRTWHDGNVVLLGDAVHTAHFSIGSGTKLAMEDAVALASAFARHPDAPGQALVEYEMERQPVVERFQQAARVSARYFERVGRYSGLHPMQFGFNLLTRSGRISHANLMLRDPDFVRQLDAWFRTDARHANGDGRPVVAPPPMFAPLRLDGLDVGNRLVGAPVGEAAADDGRPGEADAERLVQAASGGCGLVLSGLVAVSPHGRTTPRCPTLHTDEHVRAWSEIAQRVHDAGARLALQLGHAGRRGATRPRERGADIPLRRGGWPLLAASPIRYAANSSTPREMTGGDMEHVRGEFAAAAARAAAAGVDVLLLHLGHAYLLHGFISPLANRREDEYGGPLENRLRFPLSVVDAVYRTWGPDRLLGASVSATDWARGGSDEDEAVEVARRLAEHGVGLLHVVAGQAVPETRAEYGPGFLTAFSDRLRTDVGLPTLVGGYLTTADEVNTALGAGRADLCIFDTPRLGVPTGVEPQLTREMAA